MLKNILFSFFFLTLSVALLTGCKKEKISPTPGEVTANELKAVIEENKIRRVYPVKYGEVFPDVFPVDKGTQWTFSNGFIHVNYNVFIPDYNLNYLVGYGILTVNLTDGSTDKALILYME